MPSPVYSAGSPGNLISGVSVAKGTTIAAFLDLSTCIEGQVSCEMTTGTTAPTAGTVFSAYKVYGNATANTLSGSVAAGATSISISSSAGLHAGQKILLQQTNSAETSRLGEIVTISAAITGSGPYTVPISATINSYDAGDALYLIDQVATATVNPSSTSGTWAASTDYSSALFLSTSQWAIAANNTDATQTITVTMSVDKITAYE
jgi:hypothetical protein